MCEADKEELLELLRKAHVEIRCLRGAMGKNTRARLSGLIEKGLVWPADGSEERRYEVLGTDSFGRLPDDPMFNPDDKPASGKRGRSVDQNEVGSKKISSNEKFDSDPKLRKQRVQNWFQRKLNHLERQCDVPDQQTLARRGVGYAERIRMVRKAEKAKAETEYERTMLRWAIEIIKSAPVESFRGLED